ncbi:ABC transporter substrate-binding protein [Testudinibacter sp. TR-2022]|uniref:ABC transporter substrate-binding protein n=1 Tax=Testudinibacter sp. TR-2022 TaxID=2585029 RepID=UPI0011185AB4|nr:ABC transporter substrate-binding protein [Testudinibacter sp. TR-2022]TNH05493.1 ABC transporter substrate-binding protein [Pasteurellaceae bacterium Phil31]TNH10391.1 ABC transporter substrate-binding protein [Testudinibacter sp. TR-2022]TNH11216.1 ABC transporter substrate-binding protein [Testudinibacter sp. TR-2022]TNH12561.1 ABC transporter substrate-binding protein [Testudinibacter sp. TR-2022]TNH14769.1 ABC transporter substrate-binding protein [Testudinibacter sp. TR-2022]
MKLTKTLLVTALGSLAVISGTAAVAAAPQKVAITTIVEHPALEEIRKGIIDQLANEGFVDGKTIKIDYQNAQGSSATAGQIARKFVGDNPAVIIPITTPSAQPVAAATRQIPVIFSAITDPLAAKLVKQWGKNEGNVAGVSDQIPLEPQVELIRTLVPNVKNIGYVYSPGEVNSVAVLEMLKVAAEKQGIGVLAVPAQRTIDISTAAKSLVGKVQVIYTSTDNNVVSAYDALYKVAVENKIPLIAADFGSVERGAIAALATNQYNVGVETGKMAAQVLRGVKVPDLATVRMTDLDLYLNPQAAALQGVSVPQALLEKATKIVGAE